MIAGRWAPSPRSGLGQEQNGRQQTERDKGALLSPFIKAKEIAPHKPC